MEIYNPETHESDEYRTEEPGDNGRVFFKRSLFNDWLPTWEKVTFFLIGLVGLQLLGTIFSLILMAVNDSTLYNALVNFLTYLGIAVCFVLFFIFDKRGTMKRFWINVKDFKTYLYYGVITFFCIIGVEYVFSLLYYYNLPDIYGANSNQTSIESMTSAYPALMFFTTVFFAPFSEEISYRIGLVDSIGHKRRWLGILLSAVIFGLIHFDFTPTIYYAMYGEAEYYVEMLNEWLNLPIYIAMGFCLAFSYAKSGNIMSSMTAHLINNLLSFCTLLAGTGAITGQFALIL